MKQNNDYLIVGITGGIGSGKSTLSNIIKGLGYYVLDSDLIAREVLEIYPEIINYLRDTYGNLVFNDGKLDRKKLGAIVFSDKSKLMAYEEVIIPKIKKEIHLRINKFINNKKEKNKKIDINILENYKKSMEDKIIFLDAPILFEYERYNLVDLSILVDIPVDIQIQRVMQRDSLTKDEVLKRINSQLSREEKLKKADIVVDNSYDLNHLRNQVPKMLERIKEFNGKD